MVGLTILKNDIATEGDTDVFYDLNSQGYAYRVSEPKLPTVAVPQFIPPPILIPWVKHGWVIDYELTSKMENFLDLIVENKETWQRFCKGVHNKMGFSIPPARTAGGGPSEGQLKLANDLAVKNNLVIPEDTLKTSKALSQWIEGVVGTKGRAATTSKAVPKTKKSG